MRAPPDLQPFNELTTPLLFQHVNHEARHGEVDPAQPDPAPSGTSISDLPVGLFALLALN